MSQKKLLTTKALAFTALFTALIAVGAFIKIPLPVLPITLQTMFVSMAGFILGSKLGGLSAFLYMMLGLLGVPIFTGGGGLGYLLKPSFGYIIGFVIGAYITGLVLEKCKQKTFLNYMIAGLIGLAVMYVIGVSYMYCILHFYLGTDITLWGAICTGFFATIPGDIVLLVLGVCLSKRLVPLLTKIKVQN